MSYCGPSVVSDWQGLVKIRVFRLRHVDLGIVIGRDCEPGRPGKASGE